MGSTDIARQPLEPESDHFDGDADLVRLLGNPIVRVEAAARVKGAPALDDQNCW